MDGLVPLPKKKPPAAEPASEPATSSLPPRKHSDPEAPVLIPGATGGDAAPSFTGRMGAFEAPGPKAADLLKQKAPILSAFDVHKTEHNFHKEMGVTGFGGLAALGLGAGAASATGTAGTASALPKKPSWKKAAKKVAVLGKVVDNFETDDLFDRLDQEVKSRNPFVNIYRFLRDLELDPYSTPHVVWDLFILVLVFYSSVMEPYKAAFMPPSGIKPFDIIVDSCFYADIIANFFTGFDRGYEIVYDKKLIAQNYLKGWFWIDILATVEWDIIVPAIWDDVDSSTVRLIRLIKVARLARASRLVSRLTNTWTIHTGFVQATKFIVYVLIVAHLLACSFFMVPVLSSCNQTPMESAEDVFDYLHHDRMDCRRGSWRDGLFDTWNPGHSSSSGAVASCTNRAWVSNDDAQFFRATSEEDCNAQVENWYTWSPGTSCWRHAAPVCSALLGQNIANATCITGSDAASNSWSAGSCADSCGAAVALNESACEAAANTWTPASCFTSHGTAVTAAATQKECLDRVWSNGTCTYKSDPTNVVYAADKSDCTGYKFTKPVWVEETDRSFAYVIALYWSLTTMTTIGYGDFGPSTLEEIVFVLFAEVIGLSFFAVLLDQINNLNEVLGRQEAESNTIKNDVIGFMKNSQVPPKLIDQTIAFLNFKATSNSGSTIGEYDERFALLSQPLKRRIKIALFMPGLINVKMLGWAKDSIAEHDRVVEMFNRADLNADSDEGGSLDREEIRHLITVHLGMVMTEEQTDMAFMEMNSGEMEGDVELDEFEAWWFIKKFGVPKINRPPAEFLDELAFILNSKTKAVAPGDEIVSAGAYGQRMYFLLAGTVDITATGGQKLVTERSTLKLTDRIQISHENREPVCGLSAALHPEDAARTMECTKEWVVSAVTYCDLAYLEREHWPRLFDKVWPDGPDELMKVAKCFYSFGDESEPGVTEQEARPVYGVTAAEVIATTEGRLYDKIKLARQNLKTSMAGIEEKLDALLEG